MYPGRNTEARTGYAQNTQDTCRIQYPVGYIRIHAGYIRIRQDTDLRENPTIFKGKPPQTRVTGTGTPSTSRQGALNETPHPIPLLVHPWAAVEGWTCHACPYRTLGSTNSPKPKGIVPGLPDSRAYDNRQYARAKNQVLRGAPPASSCAPATLGILDGADLVESGVL